jgi:hypothetical protein
MQRRVDPLPDDRVFGDRLAAAAIGFEDLAKLRRRKRVPAVPTATERSLRSIRARINALLGPEGQ